MGGTGLQPAQAPPFCTKCNSPPINARLPITLLLYNDPLLCRSNFPIKRFSLFASPTLKTTSIRQRGVPLCSFYRSGSNFSEGSKAVLLSGEPPYSSPNHRLCVSVDALQTTARRVYTVKHRTLLIFSQLTTQNRRATDHGNWYTDR